MRKLLDAGIEVFGAKGYHPSRVDDIVKVAKTSHGTFYLYFANKEDLFRALALDVAAEMSALADSLGELLPGERGKQVLRGWLSDFAALHRHYGPVIKAWTEAEIDDSEFGRLGTSVLGDFASALARRIAASPSVGIDPAVAGLALVAMIERFNYYVVAGQVSGEADVLLDTLTEVMHAALFGAASGK